MNDDQKTGWWNPDPYSTRRKATFHYVGNDGRTLCKKWAYIGRGEIEEGMDDHPDNCAACKKARAKMLVTANPSDGTRGER